MPTTDLDGNRARTRSVTETLSVISRPHVRVNAKAEVRAHPPAIFVILSLACLMVADLGVLDGAIVRGDRGVAVIAAALVVALAWLLRGAWHDMRNVRRAPR